MKKFAFISRHVPTEGQIEMAKAQGIDLVHIGDLDAFSVTSKDIPAGMVGVIVVHPAMAMRLIHSYSVGVFENEMRAKEGDKPTFHAKALHIYR